MSETTTQNVSTTPTKRAKGKAPEPVLAGAEVGGVGAAEHPIGPLDPPSFYDNSA